jgi:hypothetical protein
VDSLVYPAFFGGPIAVTYLAAVNARRLGIGEGKAALILATGAAALIAQLLTIAFLLQGTPSGAQRFSFTLAGLLVYLVVWWVQRRPFRIFMLRGGEPANLWGAGIGAVVASVILQFILISVVNSAVK